nr:polyprenyl synthetase family protein [Vampirovibrio sp.]
FQIVDDLLDYTSTEADLGKPVLDDLRNGLLNAPVLLALESDRLSKQDKAELKKAIEALFTNNTNTPAVDTDESEIISVIRGFLDQADAIEQTRRLARQYAEEAIQSVDFIAPGEAKNAMTALVEAAIYRQS